MLTGWPASLASSACFMLVRNTAQQNQVNGAWGAIPEVGLWPHMDVHVDSQTEWHACTCPCICKKLPDQQRTPLLFLWARTSQAGSVLLCLRSWPLLLYGLTGWYFINKGLNVNSVVMWEISSSFSQDYNYMASIPAQSLCLGNLEFSVVATRHLPRALI